MTEAEAKSGPQVSNDKHRRLTTNKILCILTGVVVVAVAVPPTISTALRRWPKLCCRYEDINIKTGQARSLRYVGFVKISQEVRDTPISLALRGEVIDVVDIEPWHRVYTLSPGLHSPHYHYHSALSQAREIELIAELNELGPEEQRLIAENVLRLWQTERGDSPAGSYLRGVFKEGMEESEQDGSKKIENE